VKIRIAALIGALILLIACALSLFLISLLPDHYPAIESVAGSRYRSYGLDQDSCWLYYYESAEGVARAPAELVADWYRQGNWDEIASSDASHTEWSQAFDYGERLVGYRGARLLPAPDGTLHLTTYWSLRFILPSSCR
jgi:hypothetical protein